MKKSFPALQYFAALKSRLLELGHYLQYIDVLTTLLIEREISFIVWRTAVRARPAAVCGRSCTTIVDDTFQMGEQHE